MKFKFLLLLLWAPLACIAQNFNGDWKGTFRSEYANIDVEVIFHIVDDRCTEEPMARSASNSSEEERVFEISQGEIYIYTFEGNSKRKSDLIFSGKIEKGKLKGEYYSGKKARAITLTKFGPGKISLKKPNDINGGGMVIY